MFLTSGVERSFESLALDSDVAERLAEEVLRAVSSSVAAVAANWDHHSLVFLVVSENLLKAIGHSKEVIISGNVHLQQLWLDVIDCSESLPRIEKSIELIIIHASSKAWVGSS